MRRRNNIDRIFEKSDISAEIEKYGIPKPPHHATQGKEAKRALFWDKKHKRPIEKCPKGFVKPAVKIDPVMDLFRL